MDSTRRKFLKGGVATGITAIAGCGQSSPDTVTKTVVVPEEKSPETVTKTIIVTREHVETVIKWEVVETTVVKTKIVEVTPSTGSTASTETSKSDFSQQVRNKALKVAKDARKAVVSISATNGGAGTAWFQEDGWLITAGHVVAGADGFTCWTIEGESFSPTLEGYSDYLTSPYHDIAVLSTDYSPPKTLKLADSDTLEKGQPLISIGHPYAIGYWVVSIGRYVEATKKAIRSTIPTISGNSGGPVLTLDGKVVGMTVGSVPRDQPETDPPRPVDLALYEQFTDYEYSDSQKTWVIEKYIEEFG